MTQTLRRTTAAALLCGALLAGCSSDDNGKDPEMPDTTEIASLLLTPEDVPGATPTESSELPRSLTCGASVSSESRMESLSEGRAAAASYEVAGTTVDTAVFDMGIDFNREIAFDNGVVTGVPRCIANTTGFTQGAEGRETVRNAALPGLAAGAVGYSGRLEREDGRVRVEERAYAAVGNRIVVVGARRDDAGPLGVSVPELLGKAVAKVEAAPAQEEQPA